MAGTPSWPRAHHGQLPPPRRRRALRHDTHRRDAYGASSAGEARPRHLLHGRSRTTGHLRSNALGLGPLSLGPPGIAG
jgi:hypothetical protein